ncbi:hypothetical protein HYY72_05880 [Candidatus Woesearchaeota archaeon]|nr:hypothetical protein [Candidatus Woesearchaeota archaeon]
MLQLNYLAAGIVSFLGIACGIIVGLMALEELKAGRRYLEAFQKVLLAAIAVVFLNYLGMGIVFRIAAYAAVILLLASRINVKSAFAYPVLGLLFFASSKSGGFFIVASLVFLYGLPSGSLVVAGNLKRLSKADDKAQLVISTLISHSGFIAAALVPSLFL